MVEVAIATMFAGWIFGAWKKANAEGESTKRKFEELLTELSKLLDGFSYDLRLSKMHNGKHIPTSMHGLTGFLPTIERNSRDLVILSNDFDVYDTRIAGYLRELSQKGEGIREMWFGGNGTALINGTNISDLEIELSAMKTEIDKIKKDMFDKQEKISR